MNAQDNLNFWTKALNLPGFRVVAERRLAPDDPVRFTVVPLEEVAVCPRCGRATDTVHRRHDSAPLKDLPLGTQAVELVVRTPQFTCEHCHCYFTPSYPGLAGGIHATLRFLQTAARLIRFSDISNVAGFYGVPESTLTRWYYAFVELQQQLPAPQTKPIRSIGIDELSQKKDSANM